MMRRPSQERGFTLIELMVALVVSGVVVLGVFAFSNIQRSNASAHQRNVMIQQALEGAMSSVSQDVRQAGLGFSRACTELRIWDPGGGGRLINPGVGDPNDAVVDAVTQERYWVLRDGVQAHWRSDDGASIDLAADSLDVILGEAAYLGFAGVFNITGPIDTSATTLDATTSPLLDPANTDHLAQVQQLFPPGSFVMLAARPQNSTLSFSPIAQGQCVLLQVTDDVVPGPAGDWSIPIGASSGFNDLAGLLGDYGPDPACLAEAPVACNDDWTVDTMTSISVVPLGRLRWSRYAIDYSIATLPYLVRFDLIGHQPGIDASDLGAATDYPHCQAGACPAAGLHLPGSESPPAAVAIGPMIEDMQVAVGCDGWSDASADLLTLRRPDLGFDDLGPLTGGAAGIANAAIDEHTSASTERHADEWLGNAIGETRAADCVSYGTGEYNRDAWLGLEADPGPSFRMSPRTVRVTLVGSAEADEFAGGLASDSVIAVEDRAAMTSLVGSRQRYTLTERFSPENARWQDPRLR